ncbi:MAG: heavy metal translocating P-type ATPase [Akkermansia sp.]|nr:heavy metal translocating P-type ATPase [Akkermansia sp.]
MKSEHFKITGMSCSACSARVDNCVRRLPGVQAVEVNLLTGSMCATFDETRQDASDIIAAVKAAGYGAAPAGKAESPTTRRESRHLLRRFLCSLCFLLPLMVLHHVQHGEHAVLLQALLLLPILWFNRRFFISGSASLFRGAPNMDTLVALGAASGIIYSAIDICLLKSGVVYLESSGMILTLITFGKWLEARATGQTGDALEKLRELLPAEATLLRGDEAVTVPAADISPGDMLLVRAGERIPVDAVVTDGLSSIDESAFSGESIPVAKHPGEKVYGGTLNGNGVLRIRAVGSRENSSLADIITMVGEAAAAKAPIARSADRISGIFVPLVVLIAALTACIWLWSGNSPATALGCAISVLVISCPCALGLATPVAIMVGAGKAAQHGIIFRSGAIMEQASNTTAIILDKTGTLTTGHPVVTDVLPLAGNRLQLLRTAAALEAESHHPLAEAIRDYTNNLSTEPAADCRYLPGLGVLGSINGIQAAAGNEALMRQLAIEPAPACELSAAGKTPLYIAQGGRLLGIIAVADPVKQESANAVRSLQGSGLRTMMMTGDNELTARAIAAQVDIREFRAGVLPADKAAMVRKLQQEGYKVAMVGDGINDAPALTAADVGIAIGAGTDVAIESAGIILLRSSLTDAAAALQLSRAVIRNIRQNLFWAFFYNILTIPLAAGLYYPLFGWTLSPGIAAASMSLSSFCVVSNALRLRRVQLPTSTPAPSVPPSITMTTTITVTGMMCPHCERHMQEALLSLPGVTACTASHKECCVRIESGAPLSEDTLRATVEKAGYQYGGLKD